MIKLEDYDYPSKYDKPLDHQVKSVEFHLRNKRAFNLSDMGTGKTLVLLWTCDFLLKNKKINKVLIVSPLSCVEGVWSAAIDEHLPHLSYGVLTGSKANRLKTLKNKTDLYLINFDGVAVIFEELMKFKFDMIILDEASAYKNHQAIRSKQMAKLTKPCKAVYALTATPLAENPLPAYSYCKIVNPESSYLPKGRGGFGRYKSLVMEEVRQWVWEPREGHEKIVAALLSPSIRYLTKDCIDMPEVVYQDRIVEMTPDAKKAYDQFKKHMLVEYELGQITSANAAVKIGKLLQITSGGVKDDQGNVLEIDCKSKIDEIITLYEENGKRPVIISAVYKATVAALLKALKKYRVAKIDGSVKDRRSIIQAFTDFKLDFLILQPQAASHGLNLQVCNLMIHMSPIMSNELNSQLESRIIRPGQKNNMLIVNLVASPTEKRFYNALKNKQAIEKVMMNEFKTKE